MKRKEFNTNYSSLSQLKALCSKYIATRSNTQNSHIHELSYLLHPLEATMRIRICKKEDENVDIPEYEMDVYVDAVVIEMNEIQYCNSILVMNALTSVTDITEDDRPTCSIFTNPNAWWHYAIYAILNDLYMKKNALFTLISFAVLHCEKKNP